MATDHEEGLSSIIEGIRSSNKEDFGYLIHTSNISKLIDRDFALGEYDDRIVDDVADFDRIKEKLSNNPRGSEIMIMNAAAQNSENRRPVRSAILCPSVVYGFGRGPISKCGGNLSALMRAIILHKSPFKVENGDNCWSVVDIHNLARAYMFLVEKALGRGDMEDGYWDSNGYYIVEVGEVVRISPKPALLPANNQVLGRICTRRRRPGPGSIFHR
jgi:nucleoside-diphosphate-sugar epimerase